MVADEKKIAALKAIRDKTRAEMAAAELSQPDDQFLEEDDDFPPHEDFEEDILANRYRPDEDDILDEEYEDIDDDENDDEDDFDDQEDDDEDPDDDDEGDIGVVGSSDGGAGGWHAVSQLDYDDDEIPLLNIEFNGKNLENGEFDHENLQDANFSAANLSGVNFAGSDLRGADFSGANLTNTDLSGADLSGATFAGAQLIGTNFTGAKLKNVVFTDAFFQDAILLDLDIDDISIEELQQLIEFVAKYYPEKLDLTRINLTMLDLRSIDLSKVNLKGVDFSGVDFTGVNIAELDLSECIITPEQIAQALGRVPSAEELKRILAPKKQKPRGFKGIDLSEIFLGNGKQFGVIDTSGFKGMDVDKLVKISKKIYNTFEGEDKPQLQSKEDLEHIIQQNKANKEELRQIIEERKRRELANRNKARKPKSLNRDRDGYQR